MTPPTRPEPFDPRDADPLDVQPVDPRLVRLRAQPRPRRFAGCGWPFLGAVIGLAIWFAMFIVYHAVAGAPQEPVGRSATTAPTVPASVVRGAPLTLAGGSPPAVSHGIASWFDARGYQGAVPWWRAGQQPVWATLSRFADGRTYSVTVLVTGFCACLAGQPGERLLDLSDDAFRQLAPLSVGLIRVTMTVPVQGPRLPQTSTEGSE